MQLATLVHGLPLRRLYCPLSHIKSFCKQVDFPMSRTEPTSISKHQNVNEKVKISLFEPAKPDELENVAKHLLPTFNFAAYANQSNTIQQFVKLGVDLSKLEKKAATAELVLKLDFEKDVNPYIQFFVDLGVLPEDLGNIFTKNIGILKESLDDLNVRINYLESKRFNKEMIVAIVNRNPSWLTTPIAVIDARLGWLQNTFKLKGDDVRLVVNSLPQIITYDINSIKLIMFVLEEEMGLSKSMMKKLLLTKPRIYTKSQSKLLKSFEFVHNIMKVPIATIVSQPDVLMERIHIIKERHLFLESLGRAQYNPLLPGYISLDALIKSDELQFCTDFAKSSIESFNIFLRTL